MSLNRTQRRKLKAISYINDMIEMEMDNILSIDNVNEAKDQCEVIDHFVLANRALIKELLND